MNDTLREQAALYAIGALPPDEALAFRQELENSPELEALVRDYQDVGADLCNLAEPTAASPHLRSEIFRDLRPEGGSTMRAAIEEAGDSGTGTTEGDDKGAGHRNPGTGGVGVIPWALAACLAIAATGAIFFALLLDRRWGAAEMRLADLEAENATLTEKLSTSDEANQQLTAQLRNAREETALAKMRVETLTSQLDQSYLAAIAWDEDEQKGILHVRKLPPAEEGKDYQLWVIDPDEPAPVSAGVFTVDADGSAQIEFAPIRKVGNAGTFAVTLEKTGGAQSPAGPMVLKN